MRAFSNLALQRVNSSKLRTSLTYDFEAAESVRAKCVGCGAACVRKAFCFRLGPRLGSIWVGGLERSIAPHRWEDWGAAGPAMDGEGDRGGCAGLLSASCEVCSNSWVEPPRWRTGALPRAPSSLAGPASHHPPSAPTTYSPPAHVHTAARPLPPTHTSSHLLVQVLHDRARLQPFLVDQQQRGAVQPRALPLCQLYRLVGQAW